MSLADDEGLLKLLGLSSSGSVAKLAHTTSVSTSVPANSSLAPLDLPDLNALMASVSASASSSSGISGSASGSAPGSGSGSAAGSTGSSSCSNKGGMSGAVHPLGSDSLALGLGLDLCSSGLGALDPSLAVDANSFAAPSIGTSGANVSLDSLLALLSPPPPSSLKVNLPTATLLSSR